MVQTSSTANAEKRAENERKLQSLDRLAWLLDSSIKIPGTNRTIGLDGIIGLLPGIGVIPVIGDLFDFIFKANRRNVQLMRTYIKDPEETSERSFMSVIAFLMVLFFAMLLTIWMIFKVLG